MKVYRARAWRDAGGGTATFDALDSSGSVQGPKGWRFNDLSTEILYTADVEALAVLEVAVRPGWQTIRHVLVATIEVPDGSVVDLADVGIRLPDNWNARPVADDSRRIARQFLDIVAAMPSSAARPIGVRVPSVLNASNYSVLLDPTRRRECSTRITNRLAFGELLKAAT